MENRGSLYAGQRPRQCMTKSAPAEDEDPRVAHMTIFHGMVSHMKTTIEVQDRLLRAAKDTARKEGTTLRALVEEGLRKALESRARPKKKFRLRHVVFTGDGLVPGIDLENWEQIRSLIYEGRGG